MTSELSESPTITRDATATGVILGTAAYMSPEQARGKALDKRTDIWAFGCCLYETLTGRAAFLGETVSDTLVRILEREPGWEALPDDTPPFVRLLLHRCLQKDARERLHDIADARIDIKEASSDAFGNLFSRVSVSEVPSTGGWAPWVVASLLAVLTMVALLAPWRTGPRERTVSRFASTLPTGQTMRDVGFFGSSVALSPDGSQLVYVAREGDTTLLYRRPMDSLHAESVPGTEGARAPFFSADGSWVGFYTPGGLSTDGESKKGSLPARALIGGEVKKVSLRGGAPSSMFTVPDIPFYGGTWGVDDTVVWGHGAFGLKRVASAGGPQEELSGRPYEQLHLFPQVLPGGETVLFTIWNSSRDASIAVRHLATGEQRTLIDAGTCGRYLPTGHLVYAWAGELLAVPFDLEELTVGGLPVRVLENVLMEEHRGAAHFSLSDNGSLAYVPGGLVRDESRLVWVDRAGNLEPLPFPPGDNTVRVSPDGKRVLVSRRGMKGPGIDLWVYDLERGTQRRLTDEKGLEWWGLWTPDGRSVVYSSSRNDPIMNLYWKPADGSGDEEILVESDYLSLNPFSWSADGELLAFQEQNHPTTGTDIWVLADGEPRPFLRTKNEEVHPTFSPDGRWLAYVSDESGRWEVSVQPYPGPGAVTQISTDGGFEPVWSPDGREIYYRRESGGQVMAVSFVPDEPSPRVGKPRLLFEGRYRGGQRYGRTYDLAPDGERFLMIQDGEPPPPQPQYNIVLNWFEELKRLVPTN